ncbi:hypothetical protein ALC57_15561 [Trachymyrmex cornetzi]|uniref:CCHC-type domain-containing protein n=1 Tax=Trachymyrmex cornetzi TaxID=471704 RepID=A0A151IWR8_9HYME|nr:hypothetical protein ALC57_15561 [Trachymyrmex cornetzi]
MQNLESLQFEELKSKLELRFGETHSLQNYYSQFINRKQRFGENIASLGSDIERLSQLAYPECPDRVRDKIACAQFVSALSDGFVKRTLQMEGKTSLREATERGKAIKLIQENNFQYKKESNLNFGRKQKSQIEKNNEESEGNKFNGKRFKKLLVNKNFEGRKNNKECWECGKEGHFRSECPGKAGNKE